jgi:hypothetical protein
MKYLLTAAVLAFAAPAHTETATAQPEDFCQMIGGMADAIMSVRQSGTQLSKLMTTFSNGGQFPAELNAVVQEMAIAAYQQPNYSTAEAQQRAITEFRNDYETACYSAGLN